MVVLFCVPPSPPLIMILFSSFVLYFHFTLIVVYRYQMHLQFPTLTRTMSRSDSGQGLNRMAAAGDRTGGGRDAPRPSFFGGATAQPLVASGFLGANVVQPVGASGGGGGGGGSATDGMMRRNSSVGFGPSNYTTAVALPVSRLRRRKSITGVQVAALAVQCDPVLSSTGQVSEDVYVLSPLPILLCLLFRYV
jgi:hypothetical protein